MLGEPPRKLAMVLPAMRAGGRMNFWYAAGPHVFETIEVNMPSGRIGWFDAKKGYGFIAGDDGKDVFLPQTALPQGVRNPRKGAKVEYSVIEGNRGQVAMGVTMVASAPSLVKATRPKPDDMAAIVEDLIKLLDSAGNGLRRHRYPSSADSRKLATLLRAVADDFDVQD